MDGAGASWSSRRSSMLVALTLAAALGFIDYGAMRARHQQCRARTRMAQTETGRTCRRGRRRNRGCIDALQAIERCASTSRLGADHALRELIDTQAVERWSRATSARGHLGRGASIQTDLDAVQFHQQRRRQDRSPKASPAHACPWAGHACSSRTTLKTMRLIEHGDLRWASRLPLAIAVCGQRDASRSVSWVDRLLVLQRIEAISAITAEAVIGAGGLDAPACRSSNSRDELSAAWARTLNAMLDAHPVELMTGMRADH